MTAGFCLQDSGCLWSYKLMQRQRGFHSCYYFEVNIRYQPVSASIEIVQTTRTIRLWGCERMISNSPGIILDLPLSPSSSPLLPFFFSTVVGQLVRLECSWLELESINISISPVSRHAFCLFSKQSQPAVPSKSRGQARVARKYSDLNNSTNDSPSSSSSSNTILSSDSPRSAHGKCYFPLGFSTFSP